MNTPSNRPTCAVKGYLQGRGMCAVHLMNNDCGKAGPCVHQLPATAATTRVAPITDPAVIEATFAADFEAEGAPGREEVR